VFLFSFAYKNDLVKNYYFKEIFSFLNKEVFVGRKETKISQPFIF